jgi:alpha/beta superfamily hydrolase
LTPRLAHLHLGRGFSYGCWVAMAEELIKAAGETGWVLSRSPTSTATAGIARSLKPVDGGGGSDRRTWARA